ncbi:baseplate J/gp47 family protein [Nesterenkonia flava]|uniref:Baseplate J/gp47 family protein n=1 Tax=Nesterenkonia flava TaxID=469799 RepID=A0ABU1FRY0_9MICC|nr:baseplate J/gp47 family protein [Nesterenkonia flava]MDR5711379.1 baseplate J/gp47 family protein [Nesterenkonia flava]
MSEIPTGSPDAPQPVVPDLLDWASEEQLLDTILEHLRAVVPEFEPRAGHMEVVLAEALALGLAPLAFAVQEVPTRLVEQILALQGIHRDQGAPATGVVQFDTAGYGPVYEVPSGTRLRVTMESTGETADFLTTGRLEILIAEGASGRVRVRAEESGRHLNQLPRGASLELVDNLPFVERVTLVETTVGGRDVETDASLHSRAASTFGRLTSTLVMPEHFQQAVLSRPEVGRARIVDVYDPTSPNTAPGEDPGHVTVVVADNDGQPLTEVQRRDIAEWISDQALASLVVHVVAPTYTDVSIEVEVQARLGVPVDTVRDAVVRRLEAWLSPSQWAWGDTVRQYDVVGQVLNVPEVAGVVSVSEDIPLEGVAPLPRLQDLTVTVRDGVS